MRPVAVTLAAAVLVVSGFTLSACGSQSRVETRSTPRLPRGVATSLAARSDALSAALRRGDGCAAQIQMHGLERQTRQAIGAGRVPVAYRARLQAAVTDLASRMPRCAPPPPPQPQPQPPPAPAPPQANGNDNGNGNGDNGGEHGRGHEKGKKKHGKGNGD